MARLVAAIALALAIAVAAYLGISDTYKSETCNGDSSGVVHCVDSSSTLIEENGIGIVALLVIPVALASAQLALSLAHRSGFLRGTVAVLFVGFCLVPAFGVFLPAALLSAVAGLLSWRPRTQAV